MVQTTNHECAIDLGADDVFDLGAGDGTPDGALLGIALAADDGTIEDDSISTADGKLRSSAHRHRDTGPARSNCYTRDHPAIYTNRRRQQTTKTTNNNMP